MPVPPSPPVLGTSRLEAFSDGVLAILITIMAFQLVPPETDRLADLRDMVPDVLAFALSFAFLAIYWNNHHHLLRATERIDANVMWANMSLLFFLTLVPAATVWLAAHPDSPGPVVTYGVLACLSGAAFNVLLHCILRANPDSSLREIIGRDRKGKWSVITYGAGAVIAVFVPAIGLALYVAVSVMWVIPDRRLTASAGGGVASD